MDELCIEFEYYLIVSTIYNDSLLKIQFVSAISYNKYKGYRSILIHMYSLAWNINDVRHDL